LVIRDGELIIFSMISHWDVMMYLIAIKTLYRQLGRGKIVVLNDGSLKNTDLSLIREHVRPREIIHISDVRTGPCPSGACWERLLCIADLVPDAYVLQLDADSLVIKEMPEVEEYIRNKRSFALGQIFLGQEIYPMSYVSSEMRKKGTDYVEHVAEMNFDQLEGFEDMKYSKSSACFAGFAKGSFDRTDVEDFSSRMESLLGKRWHEWGTEKVTSNFIVANTPGSAILPFPQYVSYYAKPEIDYEDSNYLHFTGTHRFKNGFYIRMARQAVRDLLYSHLENLYSHPASSGPHRVNKHFQDMPPQKSGAPNPPIDPGVRG